MDIVYDASIETIKANIAKEAYCNEVRKRII